jgi:hypothetical protein
MRYCRVPRRSLEETGATLTQGPIVFGMAWKWRRPPRPNGAVAGWLSAIGLLAWPGVALEAASPAEQAAKSRGGDSVAERLGRLEEKVQSLQVTIGTLQSFAGPKPVPLSIEKEPAQAGAQADLPSRIQALETQISALTRHIEQIAH